VTATDTSDPLLDIAPRADAPREIEHPRSRGDWIYRRVAQGAGVSTLVIMALIAIFLLLEARKAFELMGWEFFTTTAWQPDGDPPEFGVLAMVYGTVVAAVIALVVAVPLAIATSLYITEYAPRRIRRTLTSLVDLLAAIPSVIYGMWGLYYLQPRMYASQVWVAEYLDVVPFLRSDQQVFAGSLFNAGVVVSLMVLPIITAVTREVFGQAPPYEREGALALGSTRWGMIRTVVLPFGRGGIIGGSMLGLGRALGETIAVALILSPTFVIQTKVLDPGGTTVAATIALEFPEATPNGLSGLMAAGLALFALTLGVNFLASMVVSRSRSGAGVEL